MHWRQCEQVIWKENKSRQMAPSIVCFTVLHFLNFLSSWIFDFFYIVQLEIKSNILLEKKNLVQSQIWSNWSSEKIYDVHLHSSSDVSLGQSLMMVIINDYYDEKQNKKKTNIMMLLLLCFVCFVVLPYRIAIIIIISVFFYSINKI